MLTYEEVQKLYRMERNSPTLQEIHKDFYSQTADLIASVEEKHREYLSKLIDDIYSRRKNKIVLHAIRSESSESLPLNTVPLEEKLYREVIGLLSGHKKLVMEQKPRPIEEPKPVEGNKVDVKILRAMPAIVGPDLKSYGPFKEDNMVRLPAKSAQILIENGYAKEV